MDVKNIWHIGENSGQIIGMDVAMIIAAFSMLTKMISECQLSVPL
jgi:hypothetical protein